ncbi:type VII secretion target [Saccharomonospora azurea]|uniref:ESX-1 secretion-associated protein n=1 Tax=Saccharomonospora azurea NA-128 TaxID=882081 RepID=H8G507_9PSEU|nr:type VII secretion target [Saccharomonospora azurea]EHK85297.1 hypothetical protein SZMC14600_16731 [Saccharomonospora azurea SZMC 14600]EHY91186.1 Protein of unknown function (DUF2580) [Saccharomonospora azurea NA-128]
MGDSYRVSPDEVRAHAETVRGFEQRASAAAEAGAHVAGLDDAYGILCQPFGSMVSGPQERGVEALNQAREATARLAENLDAAADAYEEFEKSVVELLEKIGRDVDAARLKTVAVPGR